MLAERLNAFLRKSMIFHHFRFTIAVFLACHLQVHHIARNSIRNKDDQVVYASYRFAFGTYIGYCHPLKERQGFFLSHNSKIIVRNSLIQKFQFGKFQQKCLLAHIHKPDTRFYHLVSSLKS